MNRKCIHCGQPIGLDTQEGWAHLRRPGVRFRYRECNEEGGTVAEPEREL